MARLLGAGGTKKVYEGWDKKEGVMVAWNTVKLDRLDGGAKNRLVNEMKVLFKLRNPHIMQISACFETSKHLVFITELLTGGTLQEFIQERHEVILFSVVQKWSRQIIEALTYLHTELTPPLIHRDLKCDNIFVDGNEGIIKIGDFGLASWGRTRGETTSMVGTPEFMAPEIYKSEKYDVKVDIYALGMCILQMLTEGDLPYEECPNPPAIWTKVMKGIKPNLFHRLRESSAKDLVSKCLELNPKDRPSIKEIYDKSTKKGDAFITLPAGDDFLKENIAEYYSSKDTKTTTVSSPKPEALVQAGDIVVTYNAPTETPPSTPLNNNTLTKSSTLKPVLKRTPPPTPDHRSTKEFENLHSDSPHIKRQSNTDSLLPSSLESGAHVKIYREQDDTWYIGTVLRVNEADNTYVVEYDAPEFQIDEHTDLSRLHLITTPGKSKPFLGGSPPSPMPPLLLQDPQEQEPDCPSKKRKAFVLSHVEREAREEGESLQEMNIWEKNETEASEDEWELTAHSLGEKNVIVLELKTVNVHGKLYTIKFEFNFVLEQATDIAQELVEDCALPADNAERIAYQLVRLKTEYERKQKQQEAAEEELDREEASSQEALSVVSEEEQSQNGEAQSVAALVEETKGEAMQRLAEVANGEASFVLDESEVTKEKIRRELESANEVSQIARLIEQEKLAYRQQMVETTEKIHLLKTKRADLSIEHRNKASESNNKELLQAKKDTRIKMRAVARYVQVW